MLMKIFRLGFAIVQILFPLKNKYIVQPFLSIMRTLTGRDIFLFQSNFQRTFGLFSLFSNYAHYKRRGE